MSTSSGLCGALEEPSREGALSVGRWVRRIHFPEMLGNCTGSLPSPALEVPQLLWPWQSAASFPQQLWSVVSVTLSERNKLCGV